MKCEKIDAMTENVRALIIFPVVDEWKEMLSRHGCTFREHEYGETVLFPEGTTRTPLLDRKGQPTNRSHIQFADGLELRDVLDDETTGKSWLLLLLSQEPMEGGNTGHDPLLQRTRVEEETEEERRDARRIAYTIAAHTLRQAVSDEFLRFQDHPRLLVISELHTMAEHLEKDAQVLMEMRQYSPEMRERPQPKEKENA